LHCVNEIRSGERVAAVTWIQSNIQSTEQRQLLFELNSVHAMLSQKDKHAPETMQLLQTYSNLFRMWADV
jgi:PKHD-type hydroxylase